MIDIVDSCYYYYLRQVNEVNGGVRSMCVCLCVCVCVCVCAVDREKVKATDFKFDTRVPRDSLDVTPKKFPQRGHGQGHVIL